MICPIMSRPYRTKETVNLPAADEMMFVQCEQENCALWCHEVKGKSVAGCGILVAAGCQIAIAAMLEKNLEKK